MKQIIQNLKTGETILEEVPAPVVKRGHLLIKTTRSLISLGTEKMLVEFGQAGLISKARQQPDKVKMVIDKIKTDGIQPTLQSVKNKLDQPLPLGYSNVGHVIEVGPGITDFQVGDRVVSNGNHAEFVCVPKNLVAKIPDGVSDEHAAFTVVSAIGLQGIRLMNPALGEVIVVVGLGLIGLLTCKLLKANGCKVVGFDFDQSKVDLAKSYGVAAYNSGSGVDPVKAAMEESGQMGVDGVLITASTSSNEVISQAANMCRKKGRIVLVGVIGLNISRADFYEKELSFQVSCSYGAGRYDEDYETKGLDYPLPYVRWTENRNFQAVLLAMESGVLNIEGLVTLRKSLEDVIEVYTNINDNKHHLGIVIEYSVGAELTRTVQITETSSKASSANLGIIGAGNFTQGMILPCLKKTPAKLKVITSSKGVSGNHAAKKYGIESSSSDFNEVIERKDVDTIVITTPHHLHSMMTVKALESGKHVFVEKPLVLSHLELNDVIGAKDKHKEQQVIVGFNRRFSPHIQKIKSLLKVTAEPMNMVFTANAGLIPKDHWTQDPAVGGGRILGEACHFIDLLSYITDSEVVHVCASAMGLNPDKYSDNVTIQLKFANGSQGTVHYFSNGPKSFAKEKLEVFSEGRVLVLDNFRKLTGFGFKDFKNMKTSNQDKGHQEQFNCFVKSIQSGGEPIIPFASVVNSTRTSLATLDSLENGCWIDVNSFEYSSIPSRKESAV